MSENTSTDREANELFRELRERVEQAERASDHKTAYIAHVAHEFRTPLNSILGFTALLIEEDERLSPEVRREHLDLVLQNARHLLHVVMDILNLAKVEAGTLEVTLEPLDATGAAAAAIETMQPQAAERGITLQMVASAPRIIAADGGRLRQILLNLLENATKYSPRGSEVNVDVVDRGEYVRIEVRDRGSGISEDNQKRLFKEFSRIKLDRKKVSGAGLGLALSKRLVELMYGRIGVESRLREGSTFWVDLPRTEPDTAVPSADAETAAETVHGGTVAVVDDEPDIRTFAHAVLERAGYRVVLDDGSPGVTDRLATAAPTVILLDLNLAEQAGSEVLKELRGVPRLSTAHVIAFTASSTVQEHANAEAAGFDSFLTKPVEPKALVHAISTASRTVSAPPDPEEYLIPLRIRFLNGLPGRISAMQQALEQQDRETLRTEVHKLRGAAGGYGFIDLSEAAGALDEWLRDAPVGEWEPRIQPLLVAMAVRAAGPATPRAGASP